MEKKHYDVAIIGAGLSGLVAAHTLTSFGIKCCLIEKNNQVGGGNLSFENDLGSIFDSGYHALDHMRSEITTKLFKKVVDQSCHKIKLNRGIFIGGELIDYNAPVEQWPKSLAEMIDSPEFDSITGDVTKDKISKAYGSKFSDFCVNEILQSYPSEIRAIKEGRDSTHCFNFIYPWFFPKVNKKIGGTLTEWDRYHNSMRTKDQYVLYPKLGGFYGFITGLFNDIDKKYCDVYLDSKEISININNDNTCTKVTLSDYEITADNYFWCAPFFGLAAMLKLPMPEGVSQTLVLGSFQFKDELTLVYHEILVGDKSHKINRISFPGNIRNEPNNLLQVEFIYPTDEIDMDTNQWLDEWKGSLFRMGLIGNVEIENFRFDIQPKGMVTKEYLDEISFEYKSKIENTKTNIFVPFVNAGPENINRLVPEVIKNTINFITSKWSD